ncbi:MAG: alpha/beta hydrolase [Acidobacteriia bacterium]|nr:alpha/beta hydrolase [Terriglobia bacterium]
MPHINVNGARLYYEQQGAGSETILFAHGLLMSGRMFDNQVEALKDRYGCITFDFRGQGQSEVTADGYDMDTLTTDAAALIRAFGCAPCHFVGLSMGGFVGMRLAIHSPELLRSLMLLETTADPEPKENVGNYRRMNLVARWISLSLVATPVMKIMFGRKFLEDPSRDALRASLRQRVLSNHRVGISRAVTGVITRQGIYEQLDQIKTPTLIVVGDQDVATGPAKAERMHARIRGSKLRIIPGAGHSSSIEEPGAVNAAIGEFLNSLH